MSIKIHIYLILMAAYMFAIGKIEMFAYYYLFVLMHELSHILVALILKVDVKEIELLPIGINAKYENKISLIRELIISFSGPIASIIFSIIFENETFVFMNICIAIFNLIPIYPLDGGRIVQSTLKMIFGEYIGKKLSYTITKFFLIVLSLVSLFLAAYAQNYYFIILTIYVLYIAKEEIKKEHFYGIINYLQIDE